MERIEKVIVIDRPVRAVYNQWTQFEEFPKFMTGVKEVRQLDDTHIHWHAEIGGQDTEWDAEITEQEPDERISWKSVSGPLNAGTVRFEPLGAGRTRVRLVMAYKPSGLTENAGGTLGIVDRQVERTVNDFKTFIEARRRETGAWRGEVNDGRVEGSRRLGVGAKIALASTAWRLVRRYPVVAVLIAAGAAFALYANRNGRSDRPVSW